MIESNLIFDIGMHTGQDTKHYLSKGFKVVAIEANPFLVEENTKRFKDAIASGQLVILNVGISDKKAVLPFYINKRLTEWSSFDKELGSRGGGETPYIIKEINCITTKDLIASYGTPYYIKVDIEGFDFYVVDDLPVDATKPPYFSCELSGDTSLIDKLYQKGYRNFKLINQADNFKAINIEKEKKWYRPHFLNIKNGLSLRIQKVIELEFPYSSSGPFGENTKGEWLTYDVARQLYMQFSTPEIIRVTKSWFDVHAKV